MKNKMKLKIKKKLLKTKNQNKMKILFQDLKWGLTPKKLKKMTQKTRNLILKSKITNMRISLKNKDPLRGKPLLGSKQLLTMERN